MKILFIHQNFPGQFKHLAPALVKQGHSIRSLSLGGLAIPNIESCKYSVSHSSSKSIHPFAIDFETKMIRGEGCATAMLEMKQAGYTPDLIIAHPGWGEAIFARDIFPTTKQLHFLEFFYDAIGRDVGFDPEFSNTYSETKTFNVRIKNAAALISLLQMDYGYAPTHWQKQSWPIDYHNRIDVIFDGIDTNQVAPLKNPLEVITIKTVDGQLIHIGSEDEVITFVNRNLEPYRGYHSFMRALPEILRLRPNARALIIGGDGVSYGAKAPTGNTWKNIFLDEVRDQLDLSRVHFLGNTSYSNYLNILKLSSCHIYFTYPFVLSWSCLEAMSAACVVVGSKTPPVEEVITHGVNGLLVDFFDKDGLVNQVVSVLSEPLKYAPIGAAARKHIVDNYDLETICLPKQIALVEKILSS
jgi:glycosyltransferase involved in cell wall biosynthesis